MKFSVFYLVLGLGCVCGCRATVDANYALTNAGVVNSGLHSLSSFYLWDMKSGTISELETGSDPKSCCRAVGSGTSFAAGGITNIGVKATGRAAGKEAAIASEIAQNAYLQLNVFSENKTKEPKTELHRDLNGEDGDEYKVQWQLEDALNPEAKLRYLKITRSLTAESAEIFYGTAATIGTSFPVETVKGTIEVEVTASSFNKFEGGTTPAIVEYAVYKIKKLRNEKGKIVYRFVDDTSITASDIAAALKARSAAQQK